MVAANRLKHATRLNAARQAKRAADGDRTHSKKEKDYYRRLRAHVIAALGDCCACCGEREPTFLQLDHIHGGGVRHLKLLGNWVAVYRAVRDAGFPKDQYRLLCSNCNHATRGGRICPHDTARRRALFELVVND